MAKAGVMLISVVTPSFNQGAFIGKCLTSVRDQEGDFEVEHIVLDNCSTDNTGAELERHYANSGRVNFMPIVERDGGQTAAINKGFKLAQRRRCLLVKHGRAVQAGSVGGRKQVFRGKP